MPRKVTPRKRPSQERARATVDALLEAAAQVLDAEGAEGFSTNKIAHRAGVSIGTLYQYFPNKESLVLGLVTAHHAEMRAVIREDILRRWSEPLPVMVRGVLAGLLEVYRRNLPRAVSLEKLCVSMGEASGLEAMLGEVAEWVGRVLASRPAELAARDPELTAFVVVRAVEGVFLGAAQHRPELLGGEALQEQLAALVLGYLTPPAAPLPTVPGRPAPGRDAVEAH
jgi:AcrR family transcriptional regulator